MMHGMSEDAGVCLHRQRGGNSGASRVVTVRVVE